MVLAPPCKGKKCFLLKKGQKEYWVKEFKKNPGYSVGVHCNIVIVVLKAVGEAVKGNKKFFQSINQSIFLQDSPPPGGGGGGGLNW